MTDPIPFDHRLTDEEFVRFGLLSENPIVRECAERLDGYEVDAMIEAGNLQDEVADLEKELQDARDGIDEAVEKATAPLEEHIDMLEELLANERSRITEFADENAMFLMKIEQLERKAEGAIAMSLEDKIDETNGLLREILATLKDGPAPAESAKPAAGKPRARKAANDDAAAAPETPDEPEEAEAEVSAVATFDDVRAAFLAYQSVHDKEKGKALVKKAAGVKELRNIGGVPEDKFSAVVEALLADPDVRAAYDEKEAA